GTSKVCYPVRTSEKGRIVKDFVARHPGLTLEAYIELIGSLCRGHSFDEIALAGALLERLPRLRQQIDLQCLERWLDTVEGWGETDSLCMSHFTGREVLARWDEWRALLTRLAGDDNIHKRRASLVLLTKAVRDAGDLRLAELAFANIHRLKGERHILITKAISWLLRELIKHHRERVAAYLDANEAALPRVALRETRKKLLTGKK
ncbi:MAG TPA: DNA alkylation repair protein, partial [Anaerolineae bacterium]|nr:DNA alkylation repair protein [Anaerolineae bacterium]